MTLQRLLRSGLVLALALASCGPDDPMATRLVFNELGATGNDFVELVNATDAPLDVSGYGVTDSRDDGLPRLGRTVKFPAGTVVPARGFLVALFEGNCPAAGKTYVCVQAPALSGGGISSSRPERVHLVDPEDRAIGSATHPGAGVTRGWTWGRVPDGTGDFGVSRRSPGTPNAR
jgi:hypothetical protein